MTSPNVAVLVMDTARAREITPQTAPNINEIAEEGTEFSNAFAAAPWTLPSHASLFTGTVPSKHGAHAGHKQLDKRLATLGTVFRSGSYETVAVSNNTWINDEFGFGRGFETFYKTWQYVQSDVDLTEISRKTEGWETIRAVASEIVRGNSLTNLANAVYGKFIRKSNDYGARRSNEWMTDWLDSRQAHRPFFLFVNYLEPHLEYQPPKRHAERFLPDGCSFEEAMSINQNAWEYIAGRVEMTDRDFEILRALYRGEISYLDQRIGELRDELQKRGEWEDTVFVVTGDHGENIGDHGLMDHQYCLYDTLLHVPLIINGGPFEGGRTVDDLVQLTDIAPTLLDVAGIDAPEMREQIQGQSFHPDAGVEPREHVIAEYMAPQPSMDALRERVGTLSDEVLTYDRSLRAIRTQEYKLIRGSDGSRECYRISDDPDEQTDLSNEAPARATELEVDLDVWLDSFEHADTDGEVEMEADTKARLEDLGYLQ